MSIRLGQCTTTNHISRNENGGQSRFMTVPEIAHEVNAGISTVRRWIANGKLPVYRLPGSGKKQPDMIRVARKDFEAFLKGVRETAV